MGVDLEKRLVCLEGEEEEGSAKLNTARRECES